MSCGRMQSIVVQVSLDRQSFRKLLTALTENLPTCGEEVMLLCLWKVLVLLESLATEHAWELSSSPAA